MRWVATALLAVSLLGFRSCEDEFDPIHGFMNTQYFKQQLDHFNLKDNRTWDQAYSIHQAPNQTAKAVFLILTGEVIYDPYGLPLISQLTFDEHQKVYNAMTIVLDTRYYGRSHPTMDLSTENLKYLTTEQILADVAHFIESMTVSMRLPSNVKWFTHGLSYGGALAAWARLKYPHLIYGAVASSPLLQAQPEYTDYYQLVKDAFTLKDPRCFSAIKTGLKQLRTLVDDREQHEYIENLFTLCEPMSSNTKKDNENLFSLIIQKLSSRVEYNINIYNISFSQVNIICETMMDKSIGNEVKRLAYSIMGDTCINVKYSNYVNFLKQTEWSRFTARQWLYQQCTELGWFKTTEDVEEETAFGHVESLDQHVKLCSILFGPDYDLDRLKLGVETTNQLYGGRKPGGNRIIYVQGLLDPWQMIGVSNSYKRSSPLIKIEGGYHCSDAYPIPYLTPEAVEAKKEAEMFLKRWIRPRVSH